MTVLAAAVVPRSTSALKTAEAVTLMVFDKVPVLVNVIVLVVSAEPELATLKKPTPLTNMSLVRVPFVTVPVQFASEQAVNVSLVLVDVNWRVSSDPSCVPRPAESVKTTLRTTPFGLDPTGEVFNAVSFAVATVPVVAKVAVAVVSPAE